MLRAEKKANVFTFALGPQDIPCGILQVVVCHNLPVEIHVTDLFRSVVSAVLARHGIICTGIGAVAVVTTTILRAAQSYLFHCFCVFFHSAYLLWIYIKTIPQPY
jgi:hypothetical protein